MDYYTTLGVSKAATPEEIKKAYRKLSSVHHPDKGGDTKKFQEINEAYSVLSDPDKKAQHDNPHVRTNSWDQSGFEHGVNSMFRSFFGGQFADEHFSPHRVKRNKDIRIEIWLTLEETLKEQTRTITLSGKEINSKEAIRSVTIPKGIADGVSIRYAGLGDNSLKDVPPGELHVVYRIKPHPVFQVDGVDLHQQIKINCFDAILGTTTEVTTLDNRVLSVTIPAGVQPSARIRIQQEGLYSLHHSHRGSIYVTITVTIPSITDVNSLNIIKQLKETVV